MNPQFTTAFFQLHAKSLIGFFLVFLCFSFSFSANAQCYKTFQISLGGLSSDIAYDIVDAGNNEFYTVGTTNSFGAGGIDVLITKINANREVVWSKTYGANGDESIRKASKTSDGGLVIIGQTKSFSNRIGDILCIKVNANGSMAWAKKFGVGSTYGDLGMEIIQTTDGGFALSGILNVQGNIADMVVIRLDKNGNITWSKKFDSEQGENGVGLIQVADSLVITSDIDHNASDFNSVITKIKINDGALISAKKIVPGQRGLFNPYIFKDNANGYWINAHMIDGNSYAQMQPVILKLDVNFNVTKTYAPTIANTFTNDFFTGFVPMKDGFLTCASPQVNAEGYFYYVKDNGSVTLSKKFSGTNERSLYRLAYINNKIISVGRDNSGSNNDFFITEFGEDGFIDSKCHPDTALVTIAKPTFTTSDFKWSTITDLSFSNVQANLTVKDVVLSKSVLCDQCIEVSFSSPDSVCVNTPVEIKNNTVGGTTFNWDFYAAKGCSEVDNPSSAEFAPSAIIYPKPGTYHINLMVDKGLLTQTLFCRTIVVVPAPEKTPLFDTSFCTGDSIVLKPKFPSGTYAWNTGRRSDTLIVNKPGTYWVQSNYYGCTERDSIVVLKNELPVVYLGKDTSICYRDNLLLNAGNPGSKYLWQDGSIKQTYLAKSSDKYSVLVTDANGCSNRDTLQLEVYAAPNFKLTKDTTICMGNQVQLIAGGNANIDSYSWFPVENLSDPAIANPIAIPADTTKYYISIKDKSGCSGLDSVVVNIAPLPTVTTIPDSAICIGTSIKLTTLGTTGNTYSWSPSNDLSDPFSKNPIATPLSNTQYKVVAKTAAGCTAETSVNISLKPLPVVSAFGDTTVCSAAQVQLNAQSPGNNDFTWFPAINLNDSRIANPIASPLQSTIYQVQVRGSNNCIGTDSVVVRVFPKPVFAISPSVSNICLGDSVILTASGGDDYSWTPVETIVNSTTASTKVFPQGNTRYTVNITNNICGVSDMLEAVVNIRPKPSITLGKSNEVDCMLGQSTLTVVGGVKYKWTPASSLSSPLAARTLAYPGETTMYQVQVTGENGCIVQDSIELQVIKGSVQNGYLLPTAFSPNNDGVNDCFGVSKWGYLTNLEFSIFNRWGERVFFSSDPSQCWDGKYKGALQPAGTFVYQVRAKAVCGDVYRKGTVVLVR